MRLHQWVIDFSDRPAVVADRKYREQLRDASSGISRNIAEGFGRWTPREFHNFLRIARACHMETESLLDEAVLRRHLSQDERREVGPLLGRCGKAIAGLMKSQRRREGAGGHTLARSSGSRTSERR